MADEKIILEIVLNTQEAQKQVDALKQSIEEQTEALKSTAKGTEEYRKQTAVLKETKDAYSMMNKVVKEQESAQKALEAQRKKALEQMAKEEQKQRELIQAATMEAKSYEDMSRKMGALNKLRKQADLSTEQGKAAYEAMTAEVLQLNNALIKMDEQINVNSRKVGSYTDALESTNMSLGEMKRELRELRNMSFSGLKPEEIEKIRGRMSELTDSIGDFQAQINTAATDRIPALMNGLQGLISSVQLVTGTLSLFGIENEKLEKSMMQLIGISQALSQLQDMSEKRTLAVAAATLKDTYAKAANAVATKAQAMATTGATVASRALGTAIKKIPFVAIVAAVIALVGALATLAIHSMKVSEQTRRFKKDQEDLRNATEKTAESTAETITTLQAYQRIAKDTTKTEAERKLALEKIREISNDNIKIYDLSTDSMKLLDIQTQKYIKTIQLQAEAEALRQVAIERYKEYLNKQQEEVTNIGQLKDREKELMDIQYSFNKLLDDYAVKMTEINNLTNEQGSAIRSVADIEADILEFKGKQYSQYYQTHQKQYQEHMSLLEAELKNAQIAAKENPKKQSNNLKETQKEKDDINYIVELNFEAAQRMDALSKGTYANYLDYLQNRQAADQSYFDYKKMLDDKATAEREKMETERSEELKAYNELRKQLGLISDGTIYDEKLEALKGYLEKKLITEKEYDKLSKQIDNERHAAQIKSFQDKFQAAAEITKSVYGSLNEIIANNYQSQLMAIDAQQKKSDEYYRQRFEQTQGDEEMQERLKRSQEAKNKELEKQRNEIALKQAKMEKAQALFDVAIKTAVAIISQLAETPLPHGAPFVVATAAAGVAQAAAVASRPLPQFSEGGYTGKGRKHDPAGIVHKGEVVFNQEDVNALGGAQAVNAMRPTARNQYWTGGIVGFGATGSAGAYNNATIEALKGLTVVATIEDINAKMYSEQKRMNIASI